MTPPDEDDYGPLMSEHDDTQADWQRDDEEDDK